MSVKTVTAEINGQSYTLTYSDISGKYEATINAPAKSSFPLEGHYYPVTVKATDDAGNTTEKGATDPELGENLRLQVVEKNAPTIEITAPTESALLSNSTPEIKWTVKDDDSGVNRDSIKLTIDVLTVVTESDGITVTQTEGGFECSYTPTEALADGSHTVSVDASDNDGNAATQKSVTFKIDTVPPILSVDSPTDNFVTNEKGLTVSGNTNDEGSSPVTVEVTVNGGDPVTAQVQEGGSFTVDVELSEGDNEIVVKATDSAGKSTEVTRHVELDTAPPVIVSVTIVPNPVDAGQTYVISAEVTDD